MIYGTRLIAESLNKTGLVKEFRDEYLKLQNLENKNIENVFYYNRTLQLQFDGILSLFTRLEIERPSELNKIDNFDEFLDRCTRLTLVLHLIIDTLNVDRNNNRIIEPHIDLEYERNDDILSNAFNTILEEDIDDLIPLLNNLKNQFFNSSLYVNYENSINNNNKRNKIKLEIQAFFYIIKQIIYQYILDNSLKSINEDNIISLKKNSTKEGELYTIIYQPSNDPNFLINPNEVLEVVYEEKDLCFITKIKLEFTQLKGMIIQVEGEKLTENGLNPNSLLSKEINQHLENFNHWYNLIYHLNSEL